MDLGVVWFVFEVGGEVVEGLVWVFLYDVGEYCDIQGKVVVDCDDLVECFVVDFVVLVVGSGIVGVCEECGQQFLCFCVCYWWYYDVSYCDVVVGNLQFEIGWVVLCCYEEVDVGDEQCVELFCIIGVFDYDFCLVCGLRQLCV